MAISTPIFIITISTTLIVLQLSLFPEFLQEAPIRRRYFIFLGITFALLALWNLYIYPLFLSPFRNLPGPKNPLPIVGHALVAFERPAGQSLLRWMNEIPNDGIIRFTGLLHHDWLLLTDPSSLSEVLVHKAYDYVKPPLMLQFIRTLFGNGLVAAEGEQHKFQRKHAMPAFSFRHIMELYPLFWAKAAEMTRCVASELRQQDGVVEMSQWATKAALDIVGVTELGHDFHSLTATDNELAKNYIQTFEPTASNVFFSAANLFIPYWFTSKLPWSPNQVMARVTGITRRCLHQLVTDKKEMIKTQSDHQVNILSILLKSNSFDDDMIVEQLLTILTAGHETTASIFSWVIYLLSTHPDIQARLREEIRAQLPSPKVVLDPTVDLAGILESLPLLNAVCLETLRLYPAIPVTIREALKQTTIGSQFVPMGTRICLVPWAINRCEKFWGPAATMFRPERWINKETGRPDNTGGVASNYHMLTFLHGPRSCIGEKFAKSELKALVAVFCGTFSMSMADTEEVPTPHGGMSLKPKNGMNLRLKEVGGWE